MYFGARARANIALVSSGVVLVSIPTKVRIAIQRNQERKMKPRQLSPGCTPS